MKTLNDQLANYAAYHRDPRNIASHFIGRTIPVIDPSDGQPFDELQRSDAQRHRRRRAVRAPVLDHAVLGPSCSRRRARPPADAPVGKVAEHADELARWSSATAASPPSRPGRCRGAGALLRVLCRRLRQAARRDLPYLDGYSVLTWREPHGVTGHIIPWNYPMQIFGRSVGGALAAGNTCVVKPAEDACLSLIRVAQLAAEVGFPPAPSTSSPATATRSATHWRATPASTTSASPAAPRWAR
jgi:aldehyde dehydrogenase (NAD+)